MTAARRTDPALELEALPPIDFVLLSQKHEDHGTWMKPSTFA